MALLSLHAAKHLKECPHLVWITPVVSGAWRNPRNWVNPIMVTSDLHLRSLISTRWRLLRNLHAKGIGLWSIAPWQKLCLPVLQLSANSQSFLIPRRLEFLEQCEQMNSFLDSVIRQGTNAHDSILEHSAIRLDDYHQVHVYVASQKRPPKRNHPIRWEIPDASCVWQRERSPSGEKGTREWIFCSICLIDDSFLTPPRHQSSSSTLPNTVYQLSLVNLHHKRNLRTTIVSEFDTFVHL